MGELDRWDFKGRILANQKVDFSRSERDRIDRRASRGEKWQLIGVWLQQKQEVTANL